MILNLLLFFLEQNIVELQFKGWIESKNDMTFQACLSSWQLALARLWSGVGAAANGGSRRDHEALGLEAERDRGRRAPEATVFVGFSGHRGPHGSWWLWGRVAPFSLLTKAERSAERQEGSGTILHGRIVCLTDGAALGQRGPDECWVCATVLQLHDKVLIQAQA